MIFCSNVQTKRKKKKKNSRSQTKQPMITAIETAILNSAGPIVTRRLLGRNGPRSIVHCSQEQFDTAATELASANIGWICSSIIPQGKNIFVKKPPHDVAALVEQYGLCTAHHYTKRFDMPLSTCISSNMRNKLVALGYVTNEQAMKGL